MSLTIRLGMLGLGTVGSGLVKLIRNRKDHLLSTFGIRFEIVGAAVSSPDKRRPTDVSNIPLSTDPLTLRHRRRPSSKRRDRS
jgi:homoserine dehydrogenase